MRPGAGSWATLALALVVVPGAVAVAGGLPREADREADREAEPLQQDGGAAAAPEAPPDIASGATPDAATAGDVAPAAPDTAGAGERRAAAPDPDPAARLPRGDDATEHWDLAAHFRSGHRLYARFLVTNQGPGDDTAVALGQVVTPEGEVVAFQNGRRDGAWRLSPDRRHLEIGSSELHFDERARRLVVDNQKRHFELSLSWPADGSGRSAPAIPGGARLELLNLASPVAGRLRIGPGGAAVALEGRVVLTHAWSDGNERASALRRIDVATFRGDRDLFLSEWRTAEDRRWQWLVVAARDAEEAPPGPFTLELRSDEGQGDPYPVPRDLELRGKRISGTVTLGGPRVLEIDPLDALPSILKLMYSFGSPRHVWLDASVDVRIQHDTAHSGAPDGVRTRAPEPDVATQLDTAPDADAPGHTTAGPTAGAGHPEAQAERARHAADATSDAPAAAASRTSPLFRIEGAALASVFFLDAVPNGRF